MPDLQYTDPDLVAVYDALNAEHYDCLFYASHIAGSPHRLVDLGCGTGGAAVRLAGLGHIVTGLDPSGAMLQVARGRPGGADVTWIEGDLAALPPE